MPVQMPLSDLVQGSQSRQCGSLFFPVEDYNALQYGYKGPFAAVKLSHLKYELRKVGKAQSLLVDRTDPPLSFLFNSSKLKSISTTT